VTNLGAFVAYVQAHSAESERPALITLFRKSAKGLRAQTAETLLNATKDVQALEHPAGHGCILCAHATRCLHHTHRTCFRSMMI
jgi:hypothetical protein